MKTLHYIMTFQALCYLALLGRLWFTGLAARYKFLCAYLVVQILGTGGLAWIKLASWTYTVAYFCVTPLLWILGYLVVLELCWLILEDYPGIAAAGRRIVSWSMALAVLIATGFAAYGLKAHVGNFPLLRSFAIVHLSVRVGLLFFLLAILYFVFRFRLRLPKNRRIYGIGYALSWSLVLISDAASTQVGVRLEVLFSCIEMLVCSGLLIAGAVMLNPAGEEREGQIETDPDEKRALLHRRLTEVNQLLLRVGKQVNRK